MRLSSETNTSAGRSLKLRNLAAAGAVAIMATLAVAQAANATVITFDDLTIPGPLNRMKVPDGYGGLDWSANFFTLNGIDYGTNFGNFPSGYLNGAVSPDNVAYNSFEGPVSFSAASSFTLDSFYLTAAWFDNLNVTVTGKLGGVVQDSQVLTVSPTAPTLETLDWSGIDEVDFSTSGGSADPGFHGSGRQFVIDNISIDGLAAPGVPEPATWALMITGFGMMGAAVRRRRTAAAA